MKSRRTFGFVTWLLGTAGASALAVAFTLVFLNDDEALATLEVAATEPRQPRIAPLGIEPTLPVLRVIERKMLEDPREPLRSDRGQNVLHEELEKLSEPDLFAALRYHDRYIRHGAAQEFENRAERLSEEARSRLFQFIVEGSKESSTAIRTLARSGTTGIDRLAPLLDHADFRIAVHVAVTLVQWAKPLDAKVRRDAADAMFLGMKEGYSHFDLVGTLTHQPYPQLLPRLRELVRDRARPAKVRADAAHVLLCQSRKFKETASDDDLPLLMSLFEDEDVKVREMMARGLRHFPKTAEVTQAMRKRVDDPSDSVRFYARKYLSEMEPEPAKRPPTAAEIAEARHKLLDPSPNVNGTGLYRVERHKDRDAMAWLVRLLAKEPDNQGMLARVQVRAGRLIAELSGKEFGDPKSRVRVDRGDSRQLNYGFNETGGVCGWGAPPLHWHIERGRRLGGENGRRIAEEAEARIESNACHDHYWEHERNRVHLEERQRVLDWWEKEGQWEYPPVVALARE